MNTRTVVIASFLLISSISVQAQWVQTNSPRHDILTYGGYITCLASQGNKLFAGTQSSGLILSTDSGSTWSLVNVTPYPSLNSILGIGSLLVNGSDLFVVAGGLDLSTDSGATWSSIYLPSLSSSISAIAVSGGNIIICTLLDSTHLSTDNGKSWTALDTLFDVTCFARMNGNLYAGTNGGGRFLTGVYVSTNNGLNWNLTDTGERSGKRFVLALTASGGNLFESTLSGMFLSSDEGATWTAIESGLPDPSLYQSRIYALAANGQNIYAGTEGSGIYFSTNNGTTWSALPDIGLSNSSIISSLLINNGNLYTGTDSGVYLSTDNGTDWTVHNPISSVISSINTLDTADGKVFASTQVGLFATTDTGTNWLADTTGIGTVAMTGVVAEGGDLFAATNGSGVFRSTNSGASWMPADTGLTNKNIISLEQNGGILYAGVNNGIFVSSNNGATWNPPNINGQQVSGNVFTIIGKNGIAQAGGYLFYSTDGGADWYDVLTGPQQQTSINSFAIIGGNVYAGISNGVWISTDSGLDWSQSLGFGLDTNATITTLLANGTTLFAGTNIGGIFVSLDSASIWNPIDSGFLARSEVTSLVMKDSILYAGTYDTGIWRHALSKPASPKGIVATPLRNEASMFVFPNPAMNSITITSSEGPISILDPLGRSYDVPRNGNLLDVSSLSPGVYFVSDGPSWAKFVKE
jgi:hypothetical protein